jgi:ferric-dicitrate binding protein FerR (iron transport regulator)
MFDDPHSDSVTAEALDWIIRIHHPEFADWDGLTAWLAADPHHAELFQQLALLDARWRRPSKRVRERQETFTMSTRSEGLEGAR